MEKERAILHCDINNFYASVALLSHPELQDKPLAICGDPEKRHGIVLAKNNIAKKCGVKTGEAIWVAREKCRDLLTLPTEFKKYTKFSRQIFDIYTDYTSEVESFGLDECWLDVSGSVRLFGAPESIAYQIKERVKKETGLTISVGVSFTKTFAKLGSDLKKPDAVSIIGRDNYRRVVWRLPVGELLFVGRSTEKKLAARNILTIGDLAETPKAELVAEFGKFGETLSLAANGLDDMPVKSYAEERIPDSIGNGTTAAKDVTNIEEATAIVFALSEMVATRLREHKMAALGVQVSLRDAALKCFTRQTQLNTPIRTAQQIADAAVKIIASCYDFESSEYLRTITVTTYHLQGDKEAMQGYLFTDGDKIEKLEDKIDGIRQKYGYQILKRAINLGSVFDCEFREKEEGYVPFGKDGKGDKTE